MALAGTLSVAGPAHAGTYTQWVCANAETGAPTGTAPELATARDGLALDVEQNCATTDASARGITLRPSGIPLMNSSASTVWSAPAGVTATAASYWRALRVAPALTVQLSQAAPAGAVGELLNAATGTFDTPFAAGNAKSAAIGGGWGFFFKCTSLFCLPVLPGTVELRVFAAKVTLQDSSTPAFADRSGGLATDGVLSGTETLGARVSDAGSGVYRVWTMVDGRVVSLSTPNTNAGRCVDANTANGNAYEFGTAAPCPASATVATSFDTRTVADGNHRFQVVAEDASGNPVTLTDRTVRVSNAVAPSPTPTTTTATTTTPAPTTTTPAPTPTATTPTPTATTPTTTTPKPTPTPTTTTTTPAPSPTTTTATPSTPTTTTPAATTTTTTATTGQTVPQGGTTAAPAPSPATPAPGGGAAGSASSVGALNGTNAAAKVALKVSWSSARTVTSRTVGYRTITRLRGTLETASGAPIAGAQLEVARKTRMVGARWRAATPVRTDAKGAFVLTFGRGSSLDVRVSYRTRLGDAATAARASATLRRRAALSFSVAPRIARKGTTVAFRGTLAGGQIPTGGKLVVLSVRVGTSGPWRQYDAVRTTKTGAFKARYRFQDTGRVTYYFRATSRFEAAYPFSSGSSAAIRVSKR